MNERNLINELIVSKLDHGKVTMWTLGNGCKQTSDHSFNAIKLFEKNNIDFEEISL